ncbi:MAG TPA: hypothetical protein PKY89_13435 [Deltaproteobacteria bacterium]|nr:hypothetical protein [Deltaproteobacteria bacterium]
MKKYAAIALAGLFLTLSAIYLGNLFFHKDPAESPAKRSKKTVQISEISENLYSPEGLSGNWILFLHYPNETASVDITIDEGSTAVSKDAAIIGDMSISIDTDGSMEMDNEQAHLKGRMNPEGNHMDGMAVLQGIKAPVPFSAFKIQDSAQGD